MKMDKNITVSLLLILIICMIKAAPPRGIIIDIHNDNTDVVHEIINDNFGSFKYKKYIGTEKSQVDHKFHAPDDVTYGCYAYYDPNGKYHVTYYVSDKRGYRTIQNVKEPIRVFPRDSINGILIKFDEKYLSNANTEYSESFPWKCIMKKQLNEDEEYNLNSQNEEDISNSDIKSANEEELLNVQINAENSDIVTTTEPPTTTTKKPKKIQDGNKKKSKDKVLQEGGNRNDDEKDNCTTTIVSFYPTVTSIYQQLIQTVQLQPLLFQAVQSQSLSNDDKNKRLELLPLINSPSSSNLNLLSLNTPSLLQLLGLSPNSHEIIIRPKVEESTTEAQNTVQPDKTDDENLEEDDIRNISE